MGAPRCANCNTPDAAFCPGTQTSVAESNNYVTLRREIDRLSRQLNRMSIELKALSELV